MHMENTTNSTLIWVFTGISIAIVALNLALRIWRKERWCHGDYWAIFATVLIILRAVFLHFILARGSAPTLTAAERGAHETFSADETYWLILNGKLLLFIRVCLHTVLWSLKLTVFDFLRRIIRKHWYEDIIIRTFFFVIAATWIAATVTVFTECHPLEKWWQIYPEPGHCQRGFQWLLTYEAGNMVTDAMLLALPFPLLFKARIRWSERLRLSLVFSLGFFLIAVCIARMIQCLQKSHLQLSRSLWASIEIFASCIVACGPSIYRLLRVGHVRGMTTIDVETSYARSRAHSRHSHGSKSTIAGQYRGRLGIEDFDIDTENDRDMQHPYIHTSPRRGSSGDSNEKGFPEEDYIYGHSRRPATLTSVDMLKADNLEFCDSKDSEISRMQQVYKGGPSTRSIDLDWVDPRIQSHIGL